MYSVNLSCLVISAWVVQIIAILQTSEVLLYFPKSFRAAVETSYSTAVDLLVTDTEQN